MFSVVLSVSLWLLQARKTLETIHNITFQEKETRQDFYTVLERNPQWRNIILGEKKSSAGIFWNALTCCAVMDIQPVLFPKYELNAVKDRTSYKLHCLASPLYDFTQISSGFRTAHQWIIRYCNFWLKLCNILNWTFFFFYKLNIIKKDLLFSIVLFLSANNKCIIKALY